MGRGRIGRGPTPTLRFKLPLGVGSRVQLLAKMGRTSYYAHMEYLAFVAALGSIALSLGVLGAFRRLRDRCQTAIEVPEALRGRVAELELLTEDYKPHREFFTQALEDLAERSDEHTDRFKELTRAVAEGIEHVDRSERRVRAAVRRAEKRLDEAGYTDPALEGEIEGLRAIDEAERGAEAVPAVPEDLGEAGGFDFSDLPGEWR